MKNLRLNLVYIAVFLTITLLFYIYKDDTENTVYIEKKEPAKRGIPIKSLVTVKPTGVVERYGVSEKNHEPLEKMVKKTRILAKSEFKRNCLDKLNSAEELISDGNIPENTQAEISRIFDGCVYEIERELVLTEKEFNYSTDDIHCLDSVNEIRDYLFDLGVRAQMFGELPNSTEDDRANIAASFSDVSREIVSRGGSALKNRTVVCFPV